jgi:glutamate-1-semialdehyde aminotransferase
MASAYRILSCSSDRRVFHHHIIISLLCSFPLPRLQFEAGFTSLAHTDEEVTATVEAAKRAFTRI